MMMTFADIFWLSITALFVLHVAAGLTAVVRPFLPTSGHPRRQFSVAEFRNAFWLCSGWSVLLFVFFYATRNLVTSMDDSLFRDALVFFGVGSVYRIWRVIDGLTDRFRPQR